MLQLEHCLSCNSSNKNYKSYISIVKTEVLEELQSCSNWTACCVAIGGLHKLQLLLV
jgi:hypothetical protein